MQTIVHPDDFSDRGSFAGNALVPTMGALHDGHASLIRRACESGIPVVVTIFVNPTQFAANEDLARYPRTLDADLELARDAGADAVFVPSVETIYPRGLEAAQREAAAWDLPPAATEPQLEDRFRPTHFGGVCLVVARLFELCRPQRAYFGEKDWQQLRVITQMVDRERTRGESEQARVDRERARGDASGERVGRRFADLEIVACPTVRESDGLAMSSRNRYLEPGARHRATALWRAFATARAHFGTAGRAQGDAPRAHLGTTSGNADSRRSEIAATEQVMIDLLESEGFAVDYAVIRDAGTLLPSLAPGSNLQSLRMLIAARLKDVRLIDNASLVAASEVEN